MGETVSAQIVSWLNREVISSAQEVAFGTAIISSAMAKWLKQLRVVELLLDLQSWRKPPTAAPLVRKSEAPEFGAKVLDNPGLMLGAQALDRDLCELNLRRRVLCP
jgi:hypothetical protein